MNISKMEAEIDKLRAENDKMRKALIEVMSYAHCNCPPDEDGVVRYHSNCQRRLMPILKKALE